MIRNYFLNLTLKQSWIKILNLKVLFCVFLSLFLISYSNASESEDELIIRAEKAIKKISTLQAQFTQISSDGSYAIGKLYFRRPFQMRLEYNVEQPFNLITTRNWLIVDEPEKKQITNIIKHINQGKILALVSDAGTPMLSDPGRLLLNQCIKEEIKISTFEVAAK